MGLNKDHCNPGNPHGELTPITSHAVPMGDLEAEMRHDELLRLGNQGEWVLHSDLQDVTGKARRKI